MLTKLEDVLVGGGRLLQSEDEATTSVPTPNPPGGMLGHLSFMLF